MLKLFSSKLDTTTNPYITNITNAVLADTPLVTNDDIEYYTQSTKTFRLKKNIKSVILNYGPDKAFAVTIDKQVIYYGKFHPAYLSSMVFGLATIDPIIHTSETELSINYFNITGNTLFPTLDKRNDSRIINVLKATGRLR